MQFSALPAFATLLYFAIAGSGYAQGRPAGVTTDVVSTREIAETVSVFGQVVAGRQSDVATRVMGVAAASPLRVGDKVETGDVVFRLDTERLRIAEAGLEVAKARLERTQKALERTRSLVSNSTVSQAQLDDRSGEYAEALGSVQEAEARITANVQ